LSQAALKNGPCPPSGAGAAGSQVPAGPINRASCGGFEPCSLWTSLLVGSGPRGGTVFGLGSTSDFVSSVSGGLASSSTVAGRSIRVFAEFVLPGFL
jgi:hypothetical protein